MKTQLYLETLEDRVVPSAADVAAFQTNLPALQSQFNSLVPVVQQTLQTEVNVLVGIDHSLPAAQQQIYTPLLGEVQQAVNAFPQLAQAWFVQQVSVTEAALLQVVDGGSMSQSNLTGGQTYSSGYGWQGYYWGYPGQPPIASPLPSPSPSPSPPTNTYTTSGISYSASTSQPTGLYTTMGSITLP